MDEYELFVTRVFILYFRSNPIIKPFIQPIQTFVSFTFLHQLKNETEKSETKMPCVWKPLDIQEINYTPKVSSTTEKLTHDRYIS